NIIYVWGEIDELTKFTEFNLFTYDQIYLSHNINLQGEFKLYWKKHHPHISTSSTNNKKCICEACIGIQENNPWSIQDATGYELHKWLDKRHTRSPFDIGLDPKLIKLNSSELQYRQLITSYAANDCDAMYQLLISMNIINQQSSQSLTIEEKINNDLELMLYDDNEHEQELFEEQQATITSSTTTKAPNYELQILSFNNNEPIESSTHSDEYMSDNNNEPQLIQTPPVEPNLINTESKQHILRQHRISFTAINFSTSSTTHECTLHIGIKDISKLETYEVQIKTLFTSEHYQQIKYKVHHRTGRHCRENNYYRLRASNNRK
ncbi:unnamed protein product, partial [Rotaria sordida]